MIWCVFKGFIKISQSKGLFMANLLTALYEEVWNENWFAGGYIWKWFIEHDRAGGEDNDRFTPQNKPAGLVIQYYYSPE